jgi:hypothetical protein
MLNECTTSPVSFCYRTRTYFFSFYSILRVSFTALCKYLPSKESLLHTFFSCLFCVFACPLILQRLHNSVLMFCFRIPNSSRKRHIHSHADTSLMDCFLCNLNTLIYCRGREAYNAEYEYGYESGRVSQFRVLIYLWHRIVATTC